MVCDFGDQPNVADDCGLHSAARGCLLQVRLYSVRLPVASAVVGCKEDGGRLVASSVSYCDKAMLAVLECGHIGSGKFCWRYLFGRGQRNRLPALRSVSGNMEVVVVFTAHHPAFCGGEQNDGALSTGIVVMCIAPVSAAIGRHQQCARAK